MTACVKNGGPIWTIGTLPSKDLVEKTADDVLYPPHQNDLQCTENMEDIGSYLELRDFITQIQEASAKDGTYKTVFIENATTLQIINVSRKNTLKEILTRSQTVEQHCAKQKKKKKYSPPASFSFGRKGWIVTTDGLGNLDFSVAYIDSMERKCDVIEVIVQKISRSKKPKDLKTFWFDVEHLKLYLESIKAHPSVWPF